jgi:hypothetical protein
MLKFAGDSFVVTEYSIYDTLKADQIIQSLWTKACMSYDPCEMITQDYLQQYDIFAPCPSFSINRKGSLTFEIASTRKDGLADDLAGEAFLIPWSQKGGPPKFVKLPKERVKFRLDVRKPRQTITFDPPDQSLALGADPKSFALVVFSNGLLDTGKSNTLKKSYTPMFDGWQFSLFEQKSIVITDWDATYGDGGE